MWKLAKVLEFTDVSKSTLYRLIKAGKFPKPVKISTRRAVWREADIALHIASLK